MRAYPAKSALWLFALAIVLLPLASPARGQTLARSLSTAYETNPTLLAARAELRAVNEGVPQAISGWRPNVTLEGSVGGEATNTHFTLPDRGLLGPHAFFDPAMLETPKLDDAFLEHQKSKGAWQVEVKKRGQVSTVTYPSTPLDAVGWHGDLASVRINVKDLRPVASHRYHLPPSVHTTFLSDRFVVCTFCPRPFETDPGALKVPFFHNNDDYDEVLFYHAGDFFSRDNIKAGMMTFHPSGFTHGPHPKALKKMLVQDKPMTDEYAVMIDTRDPLDVGDAATKVENTAYVDSWKTSE